ncbi:MAG: hypothetical protein QNK20_13305 [Aureibaculum sp.]|nr:hypothetical protein [Aureibaculum sp.]
MQLCGYESCDTKEYRYSLIELYDAIEDIRGTVLLSFEWTPEQIDKLEFQDENYRGLFFSYNHILKNIAKSNKKAP